VDRLILVAPDGATVGYPWDHYAEPGTSPATAPQWGLEVRPPRFRTDPVAEVRLAVTLNEDGDVERCRLADFGPSELPWEALPALASYLGATPEARAGLGDAGTVTSLIEALASGGRWPFDVLLRTGAQPPVPAADDLPTT
jgi:hypothetical protein